MNPPKPDELDDYRVLMSLRKVFCKTPCRSTLLLLGAILVGSGCAGRRPGLTLAPAIRGSYPQVASVSVSAIFGRREYENPYVTWRGVLLQAEPGIGGLKLGAGYSIGFGRSLRDARGTLLVVPSFGVALKAGLYRTWSGAAGLEPSRNHLGLEGSFNAFFLNAVVGYYKGEEDDFFLAGLGLGL